MSTVARKFVSVPQRSSRETWDMIALLLAPDKTGDAYKEIMKVQGVASSLISRETMESSAIVVYGGPGPRVKVYCLYGNDAIGGDGANETALATVPTQGDWKMSLPCPSEDLAWVQEALKTDSARITARDMSTSVSDDEEAKEKLTSSQVVDMEAFFRR